MIYSNTNGDTIEVVADVWRITQKGPLRDKVTTLYWSLVPTTWWPFWQTVQRSLFDQGRVPKCWPVHTAASRFHGWIAETRGHLAPGDLRDLQVEDFGQFDEWLKTKEVLSRKRNPIGKRLAMITRRSMLTLLKAGFKEAMVLGENSVSDDVLFRLGEARRRRFRGMRRRIVHARELQVLTTAEMDRLYAVLKSEYDGCRALLGNPGLDLYGHGPNPYRSHGGRTCVRTHDLIAVAAIWLGIENGVRPGELHNLTVSDMVEDRSGRGDHKLQCRQANKDERSVPLSDDTLTILRDVERWTQGARVAANTPALFVDWIWKKAKGNTRLVPKVLNSVYLNLRVAQFCHRHDLKRDDGRPLLPSLRVFRHTLGSHLASMGFDQERLRRLMGHAHFSTTSTYYIAQAKAELSHNVSKALNAEARRLAMIYRTPVDDLESEAPDVVTAVRMNPDREIDFGVCMVPQAADGLSDSCRRASSCLDCPYLVPELRKRSAFVKERDLYLQMAQTAPDERLKEQRLRHAAKAQGYVLLCDETAARVQQTQVSIDQSVSTKRTGRRSYR